MTSNDLNEIAPALCKAQSEIKSAQKNGINNFFKKQDGTYHTYSTLKDVWDACRLALNKNGLSILQTLSYTHDQPTLLRTRLLHESGQWIMGECPLLNQKGDMQGLMSALTYAKRYSLSSMIGCADEEDDDANTADQVNGKEPLHLKPTPQNGTPGKCTQKQSGLIAGKLAEKGYVGPAMQKFLGEFSKGYLPNYRFPEDVLFQDVNACLSAIEKLPLLPTPVHRQNPKVPPEREDEPPFNPDQAWISQKR